MIEAFTISFFNVLVLIIWFKTDAFVEYFCFLPIVKKYFKARELNLASSFSNFLAVNYNNHFIIRLISCVYCLNFWISILTSFFVGYKFFALIYFLSLINYKILHIISKYE